MPTLSRPIAAVSLLFLSAFSAGPAHAYNETRDRAGNLYRVAEKAFDWRVERSTDGGKSWALSESYHYQDFDFSRASVISADGAGNVYVAGEVAEKNASFTLGWGAIFDIHGRQNFLPAKESVVVRVTRDNGLTWSTFVEPFQINKRLTRARGFSKDTAGNLLLLATVYDDKLVQTWTFSKGSPDGKTWKTLDSLGAVQGYTGCDPAAMVVDGQHIYASGHCGSFMTERWVTRVSHDGGETWLPSDFFEERDIQRLFPQSVQVDRSGNVYVYGLFKDARNPQQENEKDGTLLRTSTDRGETWKTVLKAKTRPLGLVVTDSEQLTSYEHEWRFDLSRTPGTTELDVTRSSKDGGKTWNNKRSLYPVPRNLNGLNAEERLRPEWIDTGEPRNIIL